METLQTDINVVAWGFVLDWADKNKGLIGRVYNQRGQQGYLTFEDTHGQAMVFALEELGKLGEETDNLITAYYEHYANGGKFHNEPEQLKKFKKTVVGRLSTHLWENRQVRVCDVDETQPDNKDSATVNFNLLENIIGFSGGEIEPGRIHDYELLNALLSLLSAKESEILTLYMGLDGNSPKTMLEIAKREGKSEAAISQAIKKAKSKLSEAFKEIAITPDSSKEDILGAIQEYQENKRAITRSRKNPETQELPYKDVEAKVVGTTVCIDIECIKTREPFQSLFPISDVVLHTIAKNMKKQGYSKAHPMIIWKEEDVLLDGHHRLGGAKLARLEKVWVAYVSLPNELAAIDYMYQLQFRRRNVKDAEVLILAKHALSTYCKNYGDGEKAEFLAKKFVGLSVSKARYIIIVIERATPEQLELVYSERATIKSIYNQVKIVGKKLKQKHFPEMFSHLSSPEIIFLDSKFSIKNSVGELEKILEIDPKFSVDKNLVEKIMSLLLRHFKNKKINLSENNSEFFENSSQENNFSQKDSPQNNSDELAV